MLYVISGASRSGKTLIARRLMKLTEVPYMSLDWVVMGFTNGIPEYGIHDKLWPNEIAEKLWPFLNSMCESMLWSGVDCILEGEAVLPRSISRFLEKYPDKVRACFLGYTEVDREQKVRDVKHHSEGKGDWLASESDEVIISHIQNMITYSEKIKRECAVHSLAYVDTSHNFDQAIEKAIKQLLVGTPGKASRHPGSLS